jgi:hypothetical protein
MKAGETVTIYEDWLSCTKKEGEAKLVKKLSETDLGEYWIVDFHDGSYCRWIKKP